MLKKLFSKQRGFTFIELMISVAVVAIVAVGFAFYIQGDDNDQVDIACNQLLEDVRYARNLAGSKTTFDFPSLGNVYPPGGYGVSIKQNIDPTKDKYIIFADSGIPVIEGGNPVGYQSLTDEIVREVDLPNTDLDIADANGLMVGDYFTFKSANEVATNLFASTDKGKYQIKIDLPSSATEGYRCVIDLGEKSDDGYTFVSLGVNFETYIDDDDGGPDDVSCFPAGTKILMADYSSKNIEDVKVGDYVVSYDQELGQEVVTEVLALASPIRSHMCELVFADSNIKLTNEHPVYTIEGWKSINPEATANEKIGVTVTTLSIGDEVFFSGNIYKEVTEIHCWQETVQTYNLSNIKDYDTFFADNILVHNGGGECCEGPLCDPGGDFGGA